MSPVEKQLVQRKLNRIAENLKELELIRDEGEQSYIQDKRKRKSAERFLQEVIEAACDVNAHVLSEKGLGAPEDYRSGFIRMAQAGILSPSLAQQLAPSASLRNRIVHGYDVLNDHLVFNAIGESILLFPQFIAAIQAMV